MARLVHALAWTSAFVTQNAPLLIHDAIPTSFMAPTISVILPTYNRAHLVLRAIDSVLNQIFQDFELIIVDDGSTDGTKAIIEPRLADARVSYHYQCNQGAAATRNRAIRDARGTYLAFIDSDDTYMPEHLASCLEMFEKDPQLHMIHGPVEIVGSPLVPDKDIDGAFVDIRSPEIPVGGTFFALRSVIVAAGAFPPLELSEDGALLRKVQSMGFKVRYKSRASYVYDRSDPSSVTRRLARDRGASW